MEHRSASVGPRQSELVETEIDGDISLYHPHNQEVFVLNATASDVWRLCDGDHTVDQIVELLAAAYDTEADRIAGEVAEAVQMFADRDLFSPGPAS